MPAEKKPAVLWWVRWFTAIGIALLGYHFEEIENSIDWLHNLDIRSYNWISKLGVRKPRPQWTIGLEIDDETFYDYLKQKREERTDRAALAKLVKAAVHSGGAVVALDVNLTSQSLDAQSPRKEQNKELLDAIREAEQMHIPVILGFGFDITGPNRYPQESIFTNDELPDFYDEKIPYRSRIGFDNAPPDMRAIPLVIGGRDKRGGQPTEYSSLALQIVDAYETTNGIRPTTRSMLAHPISLHKFIYTSFLPQESFPKVSGQDVLEGKPEALMRLRHRIVIIGGNRHVTKGGSDWLDSGVIAPMEMRGMYFHANRVEGLLDNRLSTPVPRGLAFLLDLTLGILIIYYSGRGTALAGRLKVLGVFLIPVVLAYVASVNLGYVLNFVAPLMLLLVHGFFEHYFGLLLESRLGKKV